MSVTERRCGDCTLCCKYLAVDAPDGASIWKKAWKSCEYCVGKGCSIYSNRPEPCRAFECLWLLSDLVPEKFRPDRVKAVLTSGTGADTVTVHCLEKDRLRIVEGRSEFSRFVLGMARKGPVALSTDRGNTSIGNAASQLTGRVGIRLRESPASLRMKAAEE